MKGLILLSSLLSGLCGLSSCLPRQYHLVYDPKSWREAQSYCREKYTDLVTIHNMEDMVALTKIADMNNLSSPRKAVWIGLYAPKGLIRDAAWQWSDGSSSSFRHWYVGQPDNKSKKELCAATMFVFSGFWGDWSCHQRSAFFCYSVPRVQRLVRMRLNRKDSSVNIEDPVVMDAILQQINMKLREKGLAEDVRLSWRKQTDGKVFHKEEGSSNKNGEREECKPVLAKREL